MVSSKVQRELKGEIEFLSRGYMAKKVGNSWRVYADATGYSQTTGQTLQLGRMERDCDGRPVKFESDQDAEKWVVGGMIIWPEVKFGLKYQSK